MESVARRLWRFARSDSTFHVFLAIHVAAIFAGIIVDQLVVDHQPTGVETLRFANNLESSVLRIFARWDAAHYLNIAHSGYQADYQYAFFPGFPFLLSMFKPFGLLGSIALGLLANVVCHWGAVLSLKRIIKHALPNVNEELIQSLALLNPAFVFFTTLYSESLFSFLSWTGLALVVVDGNLLGCLFLGAASLTRSNGIFNVIPLALEMLCVLCVPLVSKRDRRLGMVTRLCVHVLAMLSCVLPSLMWQNHLTRRICQHHNAPGDYVDICALPANGFHVLSTYSRIQALHWDVGWLRQWQWRQMPNFLLSFPVLVYSCWGIYKECAQGLRHVRLRVLPWMIHLAVTSVVCLFFAHVQISTRAIFSSCPFVYMIFLDLVGANPAQRDRIFVYFTLYAVLGTVLHTNHYPWT
jgi:phosphatidylinositol glycan class V